MIEERSKYEELQKKKKEVDNSPDIFTNHDKY